MSGQKQKLKNKRGKKQKPITGFEKGFQIGTNIGRYYPLIAICLLAGCVIAGLILWLIFVTLMALIIGFIIGAIIGIFIGILIRDLLDL